MHSKVCYACPLHNIEDENGKKRRCAILQAKLDGVRGLGLASIDFKCPTKMALFCPGDAVSFLGHGEDEDSYGRRQLDQFDGYVMRWKGSRVLVVSEQTDKPFCKILPSRLTLNSEPRRRVCVHCGLPEGIKRQIKTKNDAEPRDWECHEILEDGTWVSGPCAYDPAAHKPRPVETQPEEVIFDAF